MSPDEQDALDIDRLAEEFVSLRRRGEAPSVDDFAGSHPALAEEIHALFPVLVAMERVKEDADESPLPPGAQVGDYRLLRVIGRGGMGVVYEAEQQTLGRRVALKVLPHMAHLDPRTVERFRVEAQAAARLEHPNIVPVIGYGQDQGVHFYAMQYIQGRGLDHVIDASRREGKATPDRHRRAAGMILQAAEGLAHAHAHGVLHRDVKPSNLMLDASQRLWITDFGLCKAPDSNDLTHSGDVLGTLRYLAPERMKGVSDARGDVYGLGVTLYELLTLKRAYEEEDQRALALRIASDPAPRPRKHDRSIPRDLETIVRKAMAHDPAQRYPTVDALAADLRAFLEGRPIAARTPSLGYVLRRTIARHRALSLTVAVAVLVLVAVSVWYVADLREKQRTARFGQYVASIAAAEAAFRARDAHGARRVLDAAPQEYRNWEWRHIASRLDQDLRRFEAQPAEIRSVAYHPSGRCFAAAIGNEAWVYDDGNGKVIARIASDSTPRCVRFSPQGDRLAIGTSKALEVWTWPAGTRAYLGPTEGEHRSLEFLPDGEHVIAGVVEGLLIHYDVLGRSVPQRRPFPARILSLAREADGVGTRMLLGSPDGLITLLPDDKGEELWSRRISRKGVHSVAFLGSDQVACASDGLVYVRRAEDGGEVRTHGLGEHTEAIVPDPSGDRLLAFGDHRLHVFRATDGTRQQVLSGGLLPSHGALHPGGRRLIVASTVGSIREWYLGEDGDPRVLQGHMDDVVTSAVSPAAPHAASGGFGGTICLWDLDTGELSRLFFGHGAVVTAVRFSPDGRWLASADSDGQIHVRELASGAIRGQWQAHQGAVHALAWPSKGDRLLSFGHDGRLCAWNAEQGDLAVECLAGRALEDGEEGRRQVVASHDGGWIATGDVDGRIRLWSPDGLKARRTLTGHVREVTGLAFHPHDLVLASVSSDQTLRIWNPLDGAEIGERLQHDPELSWGAGLSAVTFSPDGSRIATGSYKGTVQLWDTQTGQLLVGLEEGPWVTELHFSPDGRRLLSSHTDGDVRVRDSVALRERAPALERAASLRARAREVVDELRARHPHPDDLALAVSARAGLSEELKEAALRLAHRMQASHEAYVARMWRDLAPARGAPEQQRIALSLARGLWRATRHREEPDPRCDTLLALAYYRTGQPERTLRVLALARASTEQQAPELHAADLACAVLAHAALGQAPEAAVQLQHLEQLLTSRPEALTEQVRPLRDEAREAVR